MAEHSADTGDDRSYDLQQLRSLIRQARKDLAAGKPGEAPRQGRSYREVFQLVRDVLRAGNNAVSDEQEPSESDDTD